MLLYTSLSISCFAHPTILCAQTRLTVPTSISVAPDTLNFGKLRVGKDSIGSFRITSADPFSVQNASYQKFIHSGQFISDPGPTQVNSFGGSIIDTIHFHPLQRGYFKEVLQIENPYTVPYPQVWLAGRGIDYHITDTNFSFGKIRLGRSSDTSDITIINSGDDDVTITSISMAPTNNSRDFGLVASTLPQAPSYWVLDTIGDIIKKPNQRSFKAYFLPVYDSANNIIDTGLRIALINITTSDGGIIHDTLSGIGAEPWIAAAVPILDFGTITDPLNGAPATVTLYDTIVNRGTLNGNLNSLHNDSTANFTVHPVMTPTPIAENGSLPIAVDFQIKRTGDFVDTLFIENDSRNQPLVILRAKVRAGIAPIDSVIFSIASCYADTFVTIHNPYRVNSTIDTFWIEGDTAGFRLPDLTDTVTGNIPVLNFPVYISADSIFHIRIQYHFPRDSSVGSQIIHLIIKRPSGGDNLSLSYDTATVTVYRTIELLSLKAVLPAYWPSAGDAPFRLPIHLQGLRLGKDELNNDTLKFVFSNQLIKPVGIDRAGSLTASSPTNVIPAQPAPVWDEQSSTYSVPCVGLHLSFDSSKNTLLFTLICTAYLSKDTLLAITPYARYTQEPCGYKISNDSTVISYANECGDLTIRNTLLSSNIPIRIISISPDPADGGTNSITFSYFAASKLALSWKLYDSRGVQVATENDLSVDRGSGSLTIPMKQTGSSGAHYLEITTTDSESGAHAVVSAKFIVTK
jgi:hypothetical protein